MEEFQAIGDELGKAITEGNIDEAMELIKKAVTLDAEFEIYLQSKDNPIIQEPVKENESKVDEIYSKLIEMGVDQSKARALANSASDLDDALNQAF
jgi:hypothetical protein